MDNRVEVVIGGHIIVLKSAEDSEYLRRVASYVDKKMTDVLAKTSAFVCDDKLRTILVALNIADDYMKAAKKIRSQTNQGKKLRAEIEDIKDENRNLKHQLAQKELELQRKQQELDDFVMHFDNTVQMAQPQPQLRLRGNNTQRR